MMEIYTNSQILSLAARLWAWVSARFTGGLFYRLGLWLAGLYRRSGFHAFMSGDDRLGEKWRDSAFRRAFEFIMNLVPMGLDALRRAWGGSELMGGLAWMARRYLVPFIALFWCVILMIPQPQWLNLYSLAAALAALAIFWTAGSGYKDCRISTEHIGPWPLIFFFISLCSILTSQDPALSVRFGLFTVSCALLLIVMVCAVDTREKLGGIAFLLALGLIVCSAYAVYQRAVGIEFDKLLADASINAGMPGRVYSFFENPNSFAIILVLCGPLMLTLGISARKLWQRPVYLLAFVLVSLALLMTYSRGGWISYAFAIFIIMCVIAPRWIPLCVVIVLASMPLWPDSILNRILTIFNFSDSSTMTRAYVYSGVIRLIRDHWVFGAGLGASAMRSTINATGVYTAKAIFTHGHNLYLQIWGESGIFALAAFLPAMYLPMRSGARLVRSSNTDTEVKGILLGCVGGLAGTLLFGLTDYTWSYPRVMVIFWLFYALLLSAVKISKTYKPASRD